MKNLLINLQVFEDVYPTICFFKDQEREKALTKNIYIKNNNLNLCVEY